MKIIKKSIPKIRKIPRIEIKIFNRIIIFNLLKIVLTKFHYKLNNIFY
jgi:hypothetical protein